MTRASRGEVVGRVVFEESGRTVEATLHEDGAWGGEGAARVVQALEASAGPGHVHPASDHEVLIRAARSLRGLAWLGPGPDPSRPGPSPGE